MRFLTDHKVRKHVKKIASQHSDLMAAVAYWGQGAAERTGIKHLVKNKKTKLRIICDLLSGACNPDEIEELNKTVGIRVRTLGRLHAKVWIGGENVIVGSANASSSGLPGKGDKDANIEAAVLLTEEHIAEQAKCWFDRQWRKAKKSPKEILIWLERGGINVNAMILIGFSRQTRQRAKRRRGMHKAVAVPSGRSSGIRRWRSCAMLAWDSKGSNRRPNIRCTADPV